MVRDNRGAVNVLLTSAGRRVELIRAFQAAYRALELPGRVVVTDINPLAPALQVAERGFLVPRLDSPDYISALREICVRERISLVFPLIDPDIPVLASAHEQFAALGVGLGVVAPDAARIVDDKWETARFFRRIGVGTPESWLADDPALAEQSFPLFIKPRRGSAAKDTFRVRNRRELEFFAEYVSDPIVQEFLPGPEITTDVVCDIDGTVLSVTSRQRLEVRGGEVSKGVTVFDSAIAEACVRIARELPAVGPITVQCMMKDGRPCFTEINARFGGGLPLALAAGSDALRLLLGRAAGRAMEIPPLGRYRLGVHTTRFDDAFFLTTEERDALANRRL